ncbi:MAG TPA: hypothetical protein VEZ90_19010, partial [Blastocatellia bacterium]|nr:hypothetical protein [Blastocatellia bacterium]
MYKVCFSTVLFALLVAGYASARPGSSLTRSVSQQGQQKPGDSAGSASVSDAKPAKKEDCGCEVKQPPDVLAIVNGVRVSTNEVEEPIKANVEEIENQIVALRKRQLDLEIGSVLL